MMSDNNTLSPEAIAALEAGKKIEAIKVLREQRGIGLKQAKIEVDQYISEHPELNLQTTQSVGRVILIAVVVIIVFGIYKQFAG